MTRVSSELGAPLWDFPDGTLAGRELGAYLVSTALGWNVVPYTIIRDGPAGPGMLQRWVDQPGDDPAVGAGPLDTGPDLIDLLPAGRVPERPQLEPRAAYYVHSAPFTFTRDAAASLWI